MEKETFKSPSTKFTNFTYLHVQGAYDKFTDFFLMGI